MLAAGRPASLVYLIPIVVLLAVWGLCLVDFSRTDEREIRTFPRQTWVLILVFTSVIGAFLWIFYGRPAPPRS